MPRPPLLAATLALLASLAVAPAFAQDWPQAGKTVQVIVPAPGGSGTGDTIARVLAEGPDVRAAVGLPVAHAAEAEARDVEAGAAELRVVHGRV